MNEENLIDNKELLLAFPCRFPLKIVGVKNEQFRSTILKVVQVSAPETTDQDIQERDSGKGHYTALTITVNATSRKQLDALYESLSSHELIKFVL